MDTEHIQKQNSDQPAVQAAVPAITPVVMSGHPGRALNVARRSAGTGTGDYSNSLGCAKCYVKHLSKAIVEASEYFEDQSRKAEFILCIGDMACAEDHAVALGRLSDKRDIRDLRERMWSRDRSVVDDLRELAETAYSLAM